MSGQEAVVEKSRDFLQGDGLKETMKAWRGFSRLSGRWRGIAIEAAALQTATWIGMRLTGFRRWRAMLVHLAPRRGHRVDEQCATRIEAARQIARIQEATSRHLNSRASCLEKSLVLWWLLARRGIPAELRIGARKEAGRFEAHAWVEVGSVILNDSSEEHVHFAPFDGSIVSMETQTR